MNTEPTVIKGDSMTLLNQLIQHWAINNPLIYIPMKAYFDEKIDEYAEKHDECKATYWTFFGDTVVGTTFKDYMWAHFLLYSLPTYETHSLDEIKEIVDSFFEYHVVALAIKDESVARDVLVSELKDAKSEAISKLIFHYIIIGLMLVVSLFFSLHNQIGILIGGLIAVLVSINREKLFKLFKEKR